MYFTVSGVLRPATCYQGADATAEGRCDAATVHTVPEFAWLALAWGWSSLGAGTDVTVCPQPTPHHAAAALARPLIMGLGLRP